MNNFEIGIRKYVEDDNLEYWLAINAKIAKAKKDEDEEEAIGLEKLKYSQRKFPRFPLAFTESNNWNFFILITIIMNIVITINFYPQRNELFIEIVILVHLTCVVYWIDVIGALTNAISRRKRLYDFHIMIIYITIDLITLLPLSALYLIIEHEPDILTFWLLRSLTLIRFYRVPKFLSKIAAGEKNHWKILVASYLFYFILLIDVFINLFLIEANVPENIEIYSWQEPELNRIITGMYFVVVTMLNIGFGDITPSRPLDIAITIVAMILGFAIITNIITGAIASEIANKERRRESCRSEFEAIINGLKSQKLDKNIIEKTSDNFKALYKYKKGYASNPPVHLLPLSIRKEIYYDINFGLLSRSLIFQLQPRSFLRSVSLKIQNITYLPGDLIIQPYGIVGCCAMVASGIIEILSDENDETPIISLTSGSILGESSLFTSIPIKCVVKASTLAILQVVWKVEFIRLVSKYPYIYRSMRSQMFDRINFVKNLNLTETYQTLNEEAEEKSRKKAAKRLISELRKSNRFENTSDATKAFRQNMLNLYVLAEFIPKVKTVPITLIRNKSWILRPNTVVTDIWNLGIVLIAGFVACLYPYITAFVRVLNNEIYMAYRSIQIVYILDIFVRCLTAIERKDSYTYITSLKEILKHNMKKPGFYLDVLAAFDLTVYADLLNPNNPDYAYSLLSLNKLLKYYHIPKYFGKLENNLSINLFVIRGVKYLFYFIITLFWVAAVLYLEACPDACIENRWFEDTEIKEALNPTPCSAWPAIISIYWAGIIVAGVGYGDLRASAVADAAVLIFCIIVGVAIVTYCTAEGSSTAKHTNRSKIIYQEQVFAVDRFLQDHNIHPELQEKVRNYFRVQWDYDKGFEMQQNTAAQEMFFPQSEALLPNLIKRFLTIPLFQNTSSDFLRTLATLSRMRILPPNEIIIYSGSFNKELYIIENGYCELLIEGDQRFLVGPIKPIGYMEMILGMPIEVSMRTVTHVRLICLDYQSYLRSVITYPSVKAEIDGRIRQYRKENRNLAETLKMELLAEATTFKKSRIHRFLTRTFINVYKYHQKTNSSYWAPFHSMKYLKILRFTLLPFVITPQCIFLKILVTLRIIKVFIIGLIAPVYFSLPHQTPELGIIISILLIFTWIDMYLMFHVAYYNEKGLLVFHPAKTSSWYLKNNFLLDLITGFPFYLLLNFFFPKKEDKPSLFHDAPGLLMVLQYYKFYQAFSYIEGDILRIIQHVKLLKYIPLSIIITNVITGFLILLECNEASADPYHIYGTNTLEYEYHKSISVFCFPPNNSVEETESLHPLKFYLIAYYWVTATMTSSGFGDITAHNRTTMIAVVLITILGLFLYGYMFATLTGSMISAYNFIAKYRRNVKEMLKFLKENGAHPKIRKRLKLFYEFIWQRTEGAEPQKMLTYIHEALRLNILASIYDSTLRKVPAFKNAEKSVLASIAKCMEEVYFLRGETIVKYNDIQEFIYLVHRGRVDLFSQDSIFITSMEAGGIFGNVTKKPFSRSSIVVVATKNVDALRLNSNLFFKTLKIYPNTKIVIDFLSNLKKDYVEPIKDLSGYVEPLTPLIEDKDTLPYEITVIKKIRPSLNPLGGVDTLSVSNTFLYWRNSIYKPPWQKKCNFIILHTSWLFFFLERFFTAMSALSWVLASYMFTFQTLDISLWILSYTMDAFFIFKIWLQFHYSYFDHLGNYVVNLKKIRQRYKKRKTLIFVDIFANFPFDFFIFLFDSSKQLKMLTLFRLNRLFRYYYGYVFYRARKKSLMINKIYLELIWITVSLILLAHLFACMWIFLTRPLGKVQSPSWVSEIYYNNAENLILYLVSVYYITNIVTTTGYGDVKSVTVAEVATTIFFMISTRFGVSIFAGSVAAVINVHSQTLFLYQERISELKENFIQNNISKYQIAKMWRYVTSLWHKESGKQIPKFVENAPHVMRSEVMTSMFGSHLSESYAFSNTNDAFLRQLSLYLKRSVYFPGNYIIQQGDIDHTMYFIHVGQVSVLTIHPSLMETVHYKLLTKDCFGLSQGLVKGKPHHFTYRAESETEILSLNLDDWKHLLKYFPEENEKIYFRLKYLPSQTEYNRDFLGSSF